MSVTRQQIVECARSYMGTPYQHQGRLKGRALDCVGLPICVARDLGINVEWLKRYRNYDPFPADETVLRECRANLVEVPVSLLAEGDVVCMRIPEPCHVAIVGKLPPNLSMIHAYSPNKKVVEHDIDMKWMRRIAGVFQFPGVIG